MSPSGEGIAPFLLNHAAEPEIYTLSLHDALPIYQPGEREHRALELEPSGLDLGEVEHVRSEEHTSELQSLAYLVCRLLLEKKNKQTYPRTGRRRHKCHRHTTSVCLCVGAEEP